MKIIFIGTGSGKSSLKRWHSSFIISSGEFNLLVDAGDGVSRALLKQGVAYNTINGILLTHLHPDHYTGLASLIVQMKMNKRESPLKIFIHSSLAETIKRFILSSYLVPEKLGFELTFESFENGDIFNVNDNFTFLARPNTHLNDIIQFAEINNLSVSCSSFLFSLDNKNLLYTSDIGDGKDLYIFDDHHIDVMITEITHVSFDELFKALKLLKPDRLFFTHISEENEPDLIKLYDNLPEDLKGKIIPAVDGLLTEI